MHPRCPRSLRLSLSQPLLSVLAAIALGGCGGSTPAAEEPSGEVAVVDLGKAPAANTKTPGAKGEPAEASAEQAAEGEERAGKRSGEDAEGDDEGKDKDDLAQKYGIIGLLNSGAGSDPNAPPSPSGSGGGGASGVGGLGLQGVGSASGVGGLGLQGAGVGGGSVGGGGGIGLGSIGGTGTGSGFGSGSGRLGGSRGTPPKVKMGQTSVTGRLPPEIIQRIVRQNFGRFRLCYEAGLQKDPKLEGKVTVRFVIGKDGAVSGVSNAGSDIPDAGVMNCVVRAFQGLSFPQPEGGGMVVVVYPIMFSPGSPAPAPAVTAPAVTAPAATAPPAPKTQAPQAAPPAPSAPAAPAKKP